MTQKDKVKELVGRGLHSYHTKALQQIDRIEKKNKEQNHKISILTNELDNDYLTKTEEGSVVSLEHSKEGMVYLDELQGNTLVNYCTDGSKEMTLNGDIDLEGTFVTTIEGVDNGLVDVMCEGNTLVNLYSNNFNYSTTGVGNYIKENNGVTVNNTSTTGEYYVLLNKAINLKTSTLHTLIMDIETVNDYQIYTWFDNGFKLFGNGNSSTKFIKTFISGEASTKFRFDSDTLGGIVKFKNIMILEGDWTDREIPPYFEGMKSVGQDDENGHKIEILSRNKNLIRKEYFPSLILNGNYDGMTFTTLEDGSVIAKGTPTKSITQFCNFNYATILKHGVRYNAKDIGIQITKFDGTKQYGGFVFDKNTMQKVEVYFQWNKVGEVYDEHRYPMFAEDTVYTSDYIQGKINKKEILLNEPLRKANDFYRDRLVKIGNKCYIERNTKEVVLDGTHNVIISDTSVKDETLCRFDFTINGLIKGSNGGEDKKFICDKFPYLFIHALAGGSTNVTQECISNHSTNENSLNMVIKKSRLETIDVTGVNKWLSNNNIKIIIPIATPTYEPLEIEPILNAYNDVTHFSNNSIIPCNMKIQNTGYNAIIKPSTLYTVALDTNKSGTIGMNLGGVKGTTTNNVLTLTTPATLADDSLRLHGKGIKGSKVRLLEGDKTNWIPSHFEGMMSSFEDKFDSSDNTYKMEILSKNKNLLDVGESLTFDTKNIMINLKKGRYILDYKNVSGYQNGDKIVFAFHKGANKCITSKYLRKGEVIELTEDCDIIFLYSNEYNWSGSLEKFVTINTLQLSREEVIVGEPVTQKINKIQFSSIEPLRGVDNIKDKFVFKDGKLMIERNVSYIEKLISSNLKNLFKYINTNCDTMFAFKISDKAKTYKCLSNLIPNIQWGKFTDNITFSMSSANNDHVYINTLSTKTIEEFKTWIDERDISLVYPLAEPTYEEIPYELQKIILEGYENGTLFFDTNIPPTSTTTYAGETPIVKVTKLNKTEVLSNTNDINDNIIPYLMDMDYRVVCLQLETNVEGISMAKLFGGAYEMLKRDILSKRLSKEEYGYRLTDYFNAGKLTEEEVRELEDLI